jgi:hypothetical protein
VVESLGLSDFEVEGAGGDYDQRSLVKARRGATTAFQPPLDRRRTGEEEVVELRCTPEMVQGIDEQRRRTRRSLDGMPERFAASQVLRALGDYLDSQDALLQRLERSGETVVLEYETSVGEAQKETKLVSNLDGASRRRFAPRSRNA